MTALWVGLAAGFAVLLYFHGQRMTGDPAHANRQLSLEFVTGYLVEEALSMDNLFVFLLIFRYFKVPSELQHKVLLWGILGAILMRAVFIGAGVTLLNRFHWVTYLFGSFLVYAGVKLLFQEEAEENPGDSFITRFAQRHLRLTDDFAGGSFTTVRGGARLFTKLALVLIVVETTDVIFAVDSIPAVLAVTRQPYVVFTSNIFAILGLRSMYFALSGLMELFHFLNYGLADHPDIHRGKDARGKLLRSSDRVRPRSHRRGSGHLDRVQRSDQAQRERDDRRVSRSRAQSERPENVLSESASPQSASILEK